MVTTSHTTDCLIKGCLSFWIHWVILSLASNPYKSECGRRRRYQSKTSMKYLNVCISKYAPIKLENLCSYLSKSAFLWVQFISHQLIRCKAMHLSHSKEQGTDCWETVFEPKIMSNIFIVFWSRGGWYDQRLIPQDYFCFVHFFSQYILLTTHSTLQHKPVFTHSHTGVRG